MRQSLVETKSKDALTAQDIQGEIAGLLNENGIKKMDVFLPEETGNTWIVSGTTAGK